MIRLEDLIDEYKETLRTVRRSHSSCLDMNDRKLLTGMVSDLEYAIEWMTTARRPGNRRGIERRSYKQREFATDPNWVQLIVRYEQGERKLSDEQLQKLNDILSCLNKEQYECFVMVRGKCFTYQEVAELMNMSKSLVQYYVQSAESKIRQLVSGTELMVQGSLF